mmetsp:Transcript_26106/g.51113  ORF Transcript_26106/g.51113 Transcript_26106/m.51113 type:complete len:82 (+) Transcript_26106:1021-1266(+)
MRALALLPTAAAAAAKVYPPTFAQMPLTNRLQTEGATPANFNETGSVPLFISSGTWGIWQHLEQQLARRSIVQTAWSGQHV